MRPAGIAATLALAAALAPAAPGPKDGPRAFAAAAHDPAGNWDIYLVHPDTGTVQNLTAHPADDNQPCWSPDGKRIAFVSDRSGFPELWVMAADGGEPRQLTRDSGGVEAPRWTPGGPRWSPDGTRVAYAGGRGGNVDIYTVAVATGRITRLTGGDGPATQPAWSPDGTKLSYTRRERTVVAAADGSAHRDLTAGLDADWSPDGKRLAYTAQLPGTDGLRLYAVAAGGGEPLRLSAADNPAGYVYPRWSPDGTRIAFAEPVDGTLQVAVAKADGSGAAAVTAGPAAHAYPRWSPDGRSLAFQRGGHAGKPTALVVADADGKNPRELLPGFGTGEWKPK